jgi:cystathionine beta-lyase
MIGGSTVERTNFDERINRVGTHSSKWDALESTYNLKPDDGIPMWVADMEFKPPQAVISALSGMVDHGVFGYYGDRSSYHDAIAGWMQRRHGWAIEPSWIFTTHGLVHGTAMCVQTYTQPGEGVILLTPVYHAFARVIRANNRRLVESPLINNEGRYELDLDTLQGELKGDEKMLIFCSPHNPGGRVWTKQELAAVCAFCEKNNLLLVSDEIHHDLVYGGTKHTVMPHVAKCITSNLIMMTAGSKTFNMAGGHTGNVIIEDTTLRAQFDAAMRAGGLSPNSFGVVMTEAAYNHGDDWLKALLGYLDENRKLFDAGINAIPGLESMALEATYLAWVDFSGTGMAHDEIIKRVHTTARIATSDGPTFGKGGENFLRFNFACPRTQLEEAISRMQDAFSDIQ